VCGRVAERRLGANDVPLMPVTPRRRRGRSNSRRPVECLRPFCRRPQPTPGWAVVLDAVPDTSRSAVSAVSWQGPPSAERQPTTRARSSRPAPGCSSRKRLVHRAPALPCLRGWCCAMSATSSRASPSDTLPISRAVVSATSRLPCSIARLKVALGWPCAVNVRLPGAGRPGELTRVPLGGTVCRRVGAERAGAVV
jgi:hypothetical protein